MGIRTGLENSYVIRNNKKMRLGYTTGSCAAAAAKGAAEMLLGGAALTEVSLMTPKGLLLHLELLDIRKEADAVSCAVRKDAGDDPDTTDGLLIYARVERGSRTQESRILLDGGKGVGRVTKPGLNQPVGAAAINSVPRAMIYREVEEASEKYDYEGKLKVTIFVPEGEETAKKTFNPRLGIEGGISILGTTGIVEPMSEQALVESIRVEMSQHVAQGEEYLLVTPGNYGAEYLKEHYDLPDHRGDTAYASWDQNLAEWKQLYANQMLKEESGWYDFLKLLSENPNYTYLISLDGAYDNGEQPLQEVLTAMGMPEETAAQGGVWTHGPQSEGGKELILTLESQRKTLNGLNILVYDNFTESFVTAVGFDAPSGYQCIF